MFKFFKDLKAKTTAFLLPLLIETGGIKFLAPVPKADVSDKPARAPVAQREFVHLVGNFNKTRIELDGREIDRSAMRHVAAKGKISEYFTINAGGTTYVLWNNPDKVQRAIQDGRKNHITVEAGDQQVISLSACHLEISDAKQHIVRMASVPEANEEQSAPLSLEAQVQQKVRETKEVFAAARERRALAMA